MVPATLGIKRGFFLARPYVKTVRKEGGRVYLYLVEPQIVAGKTVGHKVLRKLSEEEARTYGWRGESYGNNQTVELEEHEDSPAEPVERERTKPDENTSTLARPEWPLKATPKQENFGELGQEEFKVVPRPRGFYALEPQRPDLLRGYSMVRTDLDGVTRVFCGLCPAFTCVHVEFMKKWLRAQQV